VDEEIIKKIATYSDKFVEKYLANVFDGCGMLKDWWQALRYFLHYSFYQGRTDTISERVEKKAMDILERYFARKSKDELIRLRKENFDRIREELQKAIGKGKVGRGRDIDMVISILDFVSGLKEEDKNVVRYSISKIKEGDLEGHFRELDQIFSIGPKVASLYLRDLVHIYSLEKSIKDKDKIYLQPIDVWVRKVAVKTGIIKDGKLSDDEVRRRIVKACEKIGVSPIKFNQGAWYVGSHSFDILLENLNKI